MAIEQEIKDLEQFILDTIDYTEKGIELELSKMNDDLYTRLINGDYKNRTGDLRRTIRVVLEDNKVIVQMLNYGFFISFGVVGKNRQDALGLTPDVAGAFGVNEGYKFGEKSNKVYGISPRAFYPIDIEERIINILQKEV